jgi:hypothetical protein
MPQMVLSCCSGWEESFYLQRHLFCIEQVYLKSIYQLGLAYLVKMASHFSLVCLCLFFLAPMVLGGAYSLHNYRSLFLLFSQDLLGVMLNCYFCIGNFFLNCFLEEKVTYLLLPSFKECLHLKHLISFSHKLT